ncbi:hypothetical protein [Ktedonosporobacter rubrisoli]
MEGHYTVAKTLILAAVVFHLLSPRLLAFLLDKC